MSARKPALDMLHAACAKGEPIAAIEACSRCGRHWIALPGGSWAEHANPRDSGPCAGCNGGGYVAPAVKPRSLDCPTCGRKGALTAREASKRYHCRDCTEIAEFGSTGPQ